MVSTVQFTPHNRLDDAYSDAENADTNIYVTPGQTQARPPLPEFRPMLPPISAPAPETPEPVPYDPPPASYDPPAIQENSLTQASNSQQTTISQQTPPIRNQTITTHDHKSINWGGVLKGVAIVSAVVLAGVVGYWALSSLTTWALGSETIATIATSVTNIAEPVVSTIGTGLSNAVGFLSYVPGIIGDFFVGTFQGLGLTTATSATTAALNAAPAALGMVGAGAGAVMVGIPASSAITHLDLTNHTPTTHISETIDPGSVTSTELHGVEAHHGHEALEIGHHATHDHGKSHESHAHERADGAEQSDVGPDEPNGQKPRSWQSRTRRNQGDYANYAEAVRASQSSNTAPTSRNASYIEAAKEEQMRRASMTAEII